MVCCFSSKEDNSEEPVASPKRYSSRHIPSPKLHAEPQVSTAEATVTRSAVLPPRADLSPVMPARKRYKSKNISISASLGDHYMTN
jgi:hypothetical protein